MKKLFSKFSLNKVNKIQYALVMLSFILPIVYLIVMMALGHLDSTEAGYHSKADYALMIMQCALGIIALHIPSMLSKRFRFEFPGLLYFLYITFLYCAIFLGEIRSFYYLIPKWDTYLHFMSSLMTGFLGMMVITIINHDKNTIFELSPFFVSVFAFSFSVMIGSLWEVYEFTFDGVFGFNMQKFMTADGEILSGHLALADTMKDIVVDAVGAFIASFVGFFLTKNKSKAIVPEIDNY